MSMNQYHTYASRTQKQPKIQKQNPNAAEKKNPTSKVFAKERKKPPKLFHTYFEPPGYHSRDIHRLAYTSGHSEAVDSLV